MELLTLLGLLLGLAIVDSINPSALVATGLILHKAPAAQRGRSIFAYVVGVFCMYFVIGLLLLAGFTVVLDSLGAALESRTAYIVQAVIGAALFAWSWLPPKPQQASRFTPKSFSLGALFGLGAVVTLAEVATALPYFGAVTLLQQASFPAVGKIGLLAIYNAIFVLPPLILLAVYSFNKERFVTWQQRREAARKNKPSDTLQWVVGAIGLLVFLDAIGNLGIIGS